MEDEYSWEGIRLGDSATSRLVCERARLKNDVEERNFEKKETVSVINRMCMLLNPKQQYALNIH
jgi:hypothetical protein